MKRQNVIYPKAEKALKTLGESPYLAGRVVQTLTDMF